MTEGLVSEPFRAHVLIVCHANHCRSPMAELLLRRAAEAAGVSLRVSSAGTSAGTGQAMHPLASTVLRQYGIDAPDWRSRLLTPAMVDTADLVLAVDRAEQAVVGRLVPSRIARTTTLLQFAHLATVMQSLRATSAETFASALRTQTSVARSRVSSSETPDVRDPMGRGLRAFENCAQIIDDAVVDVIRVFLPGPPVPSSSA